MPPWNPNGLASQVMTPFFVLMGFLIILWIQSRRLQAKLEKRLDESKASIASSLRFQEESKARAEEAKARAIESFAMQRRGLEIAEDSMRDRQEMLGLLQRIADILESRPRI